MQRTRLLCLVTALLLGLPAVAHANEVPIPKFFRLFAAMGSSPSVPAGWQGTWTSKDTIRLCGVPAVLNTFTSSDTFCTGDVYDPGGTQYSCSGTITDTNVNIHCTGSSTDMGCTTNDDFTLVGTRNGETATLVQTLNTTYTPPLCAGDPDLCIEITHGMTRTDQNPPACTPVPVKPSTWGNLKQRYR